MMNAMMHETLVTGTARKADVPGWPAAGKTGTSQDFRDAWFVGYTGHLVTGVWLGNDDNSPTRKMTGGGMPVDMWSPLHEAGASGCRRSPACPDLQIGPKTAGLLPSLGWARLRRRRRSRPAPATRSPNGDAWTAGCSTGCSAGADQ